METMETTTSPPSTLTIEGTTYDQLTERGHALIQKPRWLTPSRPPRLYPPTALRPRRVASATAWAETLAARISKASAERYRGLADPDPHLTYTGRAIGDGYYIVATDGHRALCRRGEAPVAEAPLTLACQRPAHRAFETSDALTLALQRMLAVHGRKDASVTLALDAASGRLVLYTRNPDDETTATEWLLPTVAPLDTASRGVTLQTRYLLEALGLTGQRIVLGGREDVVLIDTPDEEYRVLIQPMVPSTVQQQTVDAAIADVVARWQIP